MSQIRWQSSRSLRLEEFSCVGDRKSETHTCRCDSEKPITLIFEYGLGKPAEICSSEQNNSCEHPLNRTCDADCTRICADPGSRNVGTPPCSFLNSSFFVYTPMTRTWRLHSMEDQFLAGTGCTQSKSLQELLAWNAPVFIFVIPTRVNRLLKTHRTPSIFATNFVAWPLSEMIISCSLS
jgi:hypothetical protein